MVAGARFELASPGYEPSKETAPPTRVNYLIQIGNLVGHPAIGLFKTKPLITVRPSAYPQASSLIRYPAKL